MERKERDRTGEENINNFGSKMIIVEYRKAIDINVYFPEYNWTAENVQYNNFKRGNIKCPYERRYYGHGYIGEGDYTAWKNGKYTKCYDTWKEMLTRCFDEEYKLKHNTYLGVTVCEEWLCFQNFAEWYYENYYEIEGEKICLDKDILVKGNKIYSPNTCIFVPERINTLFTKNDKLRGKYPIGVYYNKVSKKFIAQCSIYDYEERKTKKIHLGNYNTPEKAFKIYKQFKESYIKQVADYYKDKIPTKLYDAMYKYEIEITD